MKFKKGDVIKNALVFSNEEWYQIHGIDEIFGGFLKLEAISIDNPMNKFSSIVSTSDLEKSEVKQVPKMKGDPKKAKLGLLARLIELIPYLDPMIELPWNFVPFPHQIEAVLQAIKVTPVRFMIADEAGAGKTNMAGMIYQQLAVRKEANKTLIVVPPILVDKWVEELKEYFNEDFLPLKSGKTDPREPYFWLRDKFKYVASMDLLKRQEVLDILKNVQLDFAVVDESHKMTARLITRRNRTDEVLRSQRYKLGEILKDAENLLLLTATPHRGEQDTFTFLMGLLDPLVLEGLKVKDLEAWLKSGNLLSRQRFIRRMKEDMEDHQGRPLFPPRKALTWRFSLQKIAPEYYDLYNEISNYIHNYYGIGEKQEGRNGVIIGFVKQIFQRRLASSPNAIQKTLQNRLAKVEDMLSNPEKYIIPEIAKEDISVAEDMDEIEYEVLEDKILGVKTLDKNMLTLEKRELERLIEKSERIRAQVRDPKMGELIKAMNDYPDAKIVVFTEYRDTLEYIQKNVEHELNEEVARIDGTVPMEDRKREMDKFWNPYGPRIMIATDAAGEGINLHIANVLINFDIPWNPNRLEQRMGRIHRIGQRKPVTFINLVAEDTKEGEVLGRILNKLEKMAKAIGKNRVYDVISELVDAKTISELMDEAISGKPIEQIFERVDETIEKNLEQIKNSELYAPFIEHELNIQMKEKKLTPEFLELFLKNLIETENGSVVEQIKENKIELVVQNPPKAPYLRNKIRKGQLIREIRNQNIDWQMKLLTEVVREMNKDIVSGTVLLDRYTSKPYSLWFYDCRIKRNDDTYHREMVCVKVNGDETWIVDPKILFNLSPPTTLPEEEVAVMGNEHDIMQKIFIYLEEKKKDLMKPLEDLWKFRIDRARTRVQSYANQIPKENHINKKKILEQKHAEAKRKFELLKQEKSRDLNFGFDVPQKITTIQVIPIQPKEDHLLEIEWEAMRLARRYEEERGREVIDVSQDGVGYDLKSINPKEANDIRYIEVKGRSNISSPLWLEESEFAMAKRMQEKYWLYVYYFEEEGVKDYYIKNPAESLDMQVVTRCQIHYSKLDEATRKQEQNN